MKAAVTDGKGNIYFANIPQPKIQNAYQCLCRIEASATCTGTDVKLINNTLGFGDYPCLFGHESVGVVIECGDKVRNFKAGDMALRPCAVYPSEKFNDFNSFAAGYTQFGLITDYQAFMEDNPNGKINGYARFQQKVRPSLSLSAVDAAMLITLKETASVVSLKAVCSIGKKVLVLGSGAVGLSMARFARTFGADFVVLGARRKEALKYAIDIKCCNAVVDFTTDWTASAKELVPGGFDIIIDGTGSGDIMIGAATLLNMTGKLYPYATSQDTERVSNTIGADKWGNASPEEYNAGDFLNNAVETGIINLKNYYSHTLPLNDIVEGFELIKTRKAFKVVFECQI
jgi:threonine dehydrogenase-like Zn-dependent dehydrogenase